ncbi:hypothetical protein SCLCIDRAFT_1215545, partial [Scleroderma citrinum Foug A]
IGCCRSFLNLFGKSKATHCEDGLFFPFSQSPFPAVRARGDVIRSLAPCPVCPTDGHTHKENLSLVKYEFPDCGWPSHCSEEHWEMDEEHDKYCSCLRQVNEDEHDSRSGRKMPEFQLPGPQVYEEAMSFANWDLFWYTRGFPSMDTERSKRHARKLLTYPLTIGSVLHQNSGLTLNNQRVSLEGSRSLAVTQPVPQSSSSSPLSNTTQQTEVNAEEASEYVPNLYGVPSYTIPYFPQLTITGIQANYSEVHPQFQETFDPYTDAFFLFSPGFGFPSMTSLSEIDGRPLLQIASPSEWGAVVPAMLATRCAIFVTGFSPVDVERDIRSLEVAPDVMVGGCRF